MNFTVLELANAHDGWHFGQAFTDQLVDVAPGPVGATERDHSGSRLLAVRSAGVRNRSR